MTASELQRIVYRHAQPLDWIELEADDYLELITDCMTIQTWQTFSNPWYEMVNFKFIGLTVYIA